MNFLIITQVEHIKKENIFYAYSPYVSEMNLWLENVENVKIVAPIQTDELNPIHLPYLHSSIELIEVPKFSIVTLKNYLNALLVLPKILFVIYKEMKKADHIHLRCPGNMGLLGCVVQIFFPKKIKTAKYAGNWDPNSKQPWSYNLQKWILSNTFLTRNIKVLVYGEWEKQTRNILPFFTATYYETDKKIVKTKSFDEGIKFLFVGALSEGKRPIYAIKIVEELARKGYDVRLEIIGEGKERIELESYISSKKIENIVHVLGNQTKEFVKLAYQNSHYLILPSKSEGWPKVIAEAMFWGCVPIASEVSCIPFMLDKGNRGILLEMEVEKDVLKIIESIQKNELYTLMVEKGVRWSRTFTLNKFKSEIEKLLANEK